MSSCLLVLVINDNVDIKISFFTIDSCWVSCRRCILAEEDKDLSSEGSIVLSRVEKVIVLNFTNLTQHIP